VPLSQVKGIEDILESKVAVENFVPVSVELSRRQ